MTELKIAIAEDAEFDEVVDSIADAFKVGITIDNALEDGFQLNDVLVAVQLEPTVREIINDIPVFLSQLTKLSPVTALQAMDQAKARTIQEFGEMGKVADFIYAALTRLASTYAVGANTIVALTAEFNAWNTLFKGR